MSWRLLDDLAAFEAAALATLAAHPSEQTVPLSVLDQLRAGLAWSDQPPVFAVHDGDEGTDGAVLMTPPHNLLLAVVPLASVGDLAELLRAARVAVPGLHGRADVVEAFVAAWSAAIGEAVRMAERTEMRLHVLDELRPPPRPPAGTARRAGAGDLDLVFEWQVAFEGETHDRGTDREKERARLAARVEAGCTWLWEDPAGEAVSMAGRVPPSSGVARIGPVYTPPAQRGRGYGTAVTAACTADALATGAEEVVLFTDLGNATANDIYRQIGYRGVEDRVDVRFAV